MENNKFAKIVSTSRQNKKLTQEEFASRLGVTPQAVSKWERGMGLPDISLIEGICSILTISSDELLGINYNPIVENNNLSQQKHILNNSCSEPIMLLVGTELISMIEAGIKTSLINDMRQQLVSENGILVPVFRIRDELRLKPNEYCIQLYDKVFVLNEVKEINEDTYCALITKVFEICKDNYTDILNKQIVRILIDTVKRIYPGIADDIIPEKISYLTYQKLLISIVKKGGSIKNHIKIIECAEEEILQNGNLDIGYISDIYLKNQK